MAQDSLPNDSPVNSDAPNTRYKKLGPILLLSLVVLGAAVAMAIWLSAKKPSPSPSESYSEAETVLYNALGNAAKQQKLRVGMYRATFATKADADAHKNIGTVASAVSEVDTQKGLFRSVFANNVLEDDGSFTIGRCMDGTTYNDYYQDPAKHTSRAETLQEASGRLALIPEGNLFKVTQPLTYISCPHLGLLPGSPPIAMSRLSDGVIPVTLSEPQAKSWQQKLTQAKLFTVKDEGKGTYNGRSYRKITITPNDESTSQKLYGIFYETAEIAKTKAQQPNAEVDYEFQPINPNNTGSVGGYYLIDEDRNLPMYSELYGTNPNKATQLGVGAAKNNIARTKQSYSYPQQLSMGLETPLEFLQ